MRWFAPIVLVALVAAGTARPAHAQLRPGTPTLRATSAPTKLAPRRAALVRGAVAERRSQSDEVFTVPRVEVAPPLRVVAVIAPPGPPCLCPVSATVAQIARGPPPGRVVTPHP